MREKMRSWILTLKMELTFQLDDIMQRHLLENRVFCTDHQELFRTPSARSTCKVTFMKHSLKRGRVSIAPIIFCCETFPIFKL